MRFRVLGTLEVTDGAATVPVAGAKVRTLLASLLIHPNHQLSPAALADRLWGEQPPAAPRRVVQTNIVRLRQMLPWRDAIVTAPGGYLARVPDDQLDLLAFRRLLARADSSGDLETEAGCLAEALRLWRGPVCADIDSPRLQDLDAPPLNELRLLAYDRRIEIDLRLGRNAGLIAELHRLTAEYPMREGFWLCLMAALHQQGRRGEALEAYHAISHRLVNDLGIEPGERLREVHQQILNGHGDHPLLSPKHLVGITPATPRQARRIPHELPSSVEPFIGREPEIALMDKASHEHTERGTNVVVVVGPAGVGKTELTSHWANRAIDAFPGGQVYLDLCGYACGPPLDETTALAALLTAVGVAEEDIPGGVAARAALLRTHTAGRRLLLVLDNARDSAQVRSLLPGATCTVVITSRDQLRELVTRHCAQRITLHGVDPDESLAVLASIAGSARITPHREHAHRIAKLCDYSPLALRIAAERLLRVPSLSLHHLLSLMADEPGRIRALSREPDGPANLRTVLSWSFQTLDAETARVLHTLATTLPAEHITAISSASASGMSPREVVHRLDRLVAVHLLEQLGDDWYRLSGLVRAYLAEQHPRAQRAHPMTLIPFPLPFQPTRPHLRFPPAIHPQATA